MRATQLDRALAAGVDPVSTPALAARAGILRTRRVREALASGIYLTLKDARSGTPPLPMRVPVARDAFDGAAASTQPNHRSSVAT